MKLLHGVERLQKILLYRKECLRASKKAKIGSCLVIFGLILQCFSHPIHTILMPWRTQDPLWV